MATKNSSSKKIVVLSGGTGCTAERVLESALAQFSDHNIQIVRVANVSGCEGAVEAVANAANDGAIVCHTLVSPEVHAAVNEQLLRLNVPAVDPLGPVISLLADYLEVAPHGLAGLAAELRDEQFNRSDAVDFTLAHDDGQRIGSLAEADVVLTGVSRVSKSVTCFYLAARGVRAANVPLVPALPLPVELERVEPRRIIGLTMNSARLCAIRQARLNRISNRPVRDYADRQHLASELIHAKQLMDRHGWRCIDVSYRATEEVASEIIELLPQCERRNHVRQAISR